MELYSFSCLACRRSSNVSTQLSHLPSELRSRSFSGSFTLISRMRNKELFSFLMKNGRWLLQRTLLRYVPWSVTLPEPLTALFEHRSITIPDVAYVVDNGKVKIGFDPSIGISKLEETWVTNGKGAGAQDAHSEESRAAASSHPWDYLFQPPLAFSLPGGHPVLPAYSQPAQLASSRSGLALFYAIFKLSPVQYCKLSRFRQAC